MKELKKMEKPELGYTELATDDVITTSSIIPPAKSPMKNSGSNPDDGYHMGFGFGDPLQ